MLRSAGPLLLLLLAATTAQQPDCDLGQPGALSDCVKQLLEGLRNDVHQRSDPQRLDDVRGCKGIVCHTISDINIHGLSSYEIRHLNVTFPPPEGTRLSVQATIGWQRLRGNLFARLRAEKTIRIFRKKIPLRASISGDIEIRVKHPEGRLDVTIQIDVNENGTITARPVNTDVTVTLGDIDVDVRLGGAGRYVDRLIGNPTSVIAELVAEQYWKREWRSKVERKAKEALEEAIAEKLGVQLSSLLHN